MTQRRDLLGLALASGAAWAAPGWLAGARAQRPGGTLRIGMAAPNTTLDPHLLSNTPNNAVSGHIFDSLIVNDERSRSTPGLAESWTRRDDTHWVFRLRDTRFHDGTPFTAEDAIVSLQRATDLPSAASFRTYTRSIKSMSAPEPLTLVVETRAPDPLLLNSLSRVRIISAKFKDTPSAEYNAGRAAIGTGPYKLQEYIPGNRVVLARNDAWWGPRTPWDTVVLRAVTDDAARLAGLLAGDLDIVEAVIQGGDRVRADARFHLIRGVSSRFVYLGTDQVNDVSPFITGNDGRPLDRNPLKDLRVRQALSLAINRQAMVERVMEGDALIASQFLPKGSPGTSPNLEPPPFDPNRARALLAEAGYPRGFRLTVHGPNDRYINDAKIVQAVAQMFTRVGVETKAEVMPWSTYAGKNSQRTEHSVFLGAWGVNTGETSNPMSALVATRDAQAGLGVSNGGRYANPEVDRRLKEALRTMEDDARNTLLGEASEILFRDVALIPLHHEVSVWAARRGVNYVARADQATLAVGVKQED
ncbi:peptide/nickel transport system substrate-binding protein [Roseomonas rosea]|uniref:Peptide/nickel transport system substrate-binding protein n=1 Tax=Muricoccus roseus TaxID=198092 RepID=A0A1M6A6Z5_9PROT|nr:ABC transporter substrate-binding protein [Roseomonas rosea]SHI32199.1 peptide/nickel transport system substrate-binding protein [Roseomonas rosea]